MAHSTAYIGIGSNKGNREEYLEKACFLINETAGSIIKRSKIYETEPWGFVCEDKFLNMAVSIQTELTPYRLLNELMKIETVLGRTRTEEGYASRTLDLDLLLYDDMIIKDSELTIPHPLMHKRRFVLEPLCDICPDKIHPVLQKSIRELLLLSA